MAVANVSMLESSFVGGNRSPASWRRGDRVRSTTRTSSILQMWRELEQERALSCPSRNVETNDQFEGPYMGNCERSGWLDENECERVRIIREWIEMTTEQSDTSGGHREEQDTGFSSQIERVRDGLVVDRCELGGRRAMRRLCGRQTLLDLLMRTKREIKIELQGLLENRPVSDFAHRNRIQSLLKGRFLRNGTLVQEKRPTSLAASELGLLRQRHTVSGLREGYLSKLDSNVQSPRAQSETSFNSELSDHGDQQTQSNNLQDIPDEISEEFEDGNTESDQSGFQIDDFENNEHGDTHLQEVTPIVDGRQEQVSGVDDSLQDNTGGEDYIWQEELYQVEDLRESIIGNEENDWHQLNEDVFGEDTDQYLHENSYEWYQEREGNDLQESNECHGNNLDENSENWLDESAHREAAPVALTDAFYPSDDDDNGHHLELRQLLSRRRVSNLLQSGFRESLNQLIQSYVERQGHASDDWELDIMSPSPGSNDHLGEDNELQRDENESEREAVDRSRLVFPSPVITPPQASWDQDVHGASNWQPPNIDGQLGNECEIINDLRINMVRLHQRMDDMQRMLEACMDMQLELQRSVRQEVSAALNRTPFSPAAACENSLVNEEAKWGHVRQGLCCMCGENNIHSLLYRCGHMCTCLECAEKLMEDSKMCPMCHAPILEVIRAYPIN